MQEKCLTCGTDVIRTTENNEEVVRPANPNFHHTKSDFSVPFYCEICGAIKLSLRPIRDKVFVYQKPLPEKIGSIHLPDTTDYRGGGTKTVLGENKFCVLAKGPGAWGKADPRDPKCKKDKWYSTDHIEVGDLVLLSTKNIPAKMKAIGNDGKEYNFVLCNGVDIYAAWVPDEEPVAEEVMA